MNLLRLNLLLGLAGLGTLLLIDSRAFGASDPVALSTNQPLRSLGNGLFELGRVRLDPAKRSLEIPAVVQMTEGPVEYLLVHSTGKLHESILKTDAQPFEVHLARLLVSPSKQAASTNATASAAADHSAVSVFVEWDTPAGVQRRRGEELVINLETKSPMTKGPWTYIGSRVVDGTFLAQRDGSIISIIADPDALVENPRPGREDDENWRPNSDALPAVGSPVRVTLRWSDEK